MITMRSQMCKMIFEDLRLQPHESRKHKSKLTAFVSIGTIVVVPLLTQCGTSIDTGRNAKTPAYFPGGENGNGQPGSKEEDSTNSSTGPESNLGSASTSTDSMVDSEGRVSCAGTSTTASSIYSSFCNSPETEAQRANFGSIITRFCDNGEYQNMVHPSCSISNAANEQTELHKLVHVIDKTPEDSPAESFKFLGAYAVNLPPAHDPFQGFNEMYLLAHGNPTKFLLKNFKLPQDTRISVAPPLTDEQINLISLKEKSLKFTYRISVDSDKLSLQFNSNMTAGVNQAPTLGGSKSLPKVGNVYAYFDDADVKDHARLNARRILTIAVELPNGSTAVIAIEELDIPDAGFHEKVQNGLVTYFKTRVNFLVDNARFYAAH